MLKKITPLTFRGKCYQCNRPQSSCMCPYVHKIDTNTQFIILMHPKEHQKTKNGTGYLTHLSLSNSTIFRGVDFTHHRQINTLINNPNNQCYVLYPGDDSINLSNESLPKEKKNKVIFIIDSTWACSKKILGLSENLHDLPKISFDNSLTSNFKIKTQPQKYCLSTIESTKTLLQLLNGQNIEKIEDNKLEKFLTPFEKMVEYQIECAKRKSLREENKK